MATSNSPDEINLQDLKVEEAATGETKEKTAKPKKEKPKQEKPKQEKLKQEKPKPQAAAVEAPLEELDFNRTPEEVEKALEQWTKKSLALNQSKPGEKLYVIPLFFLPSFHSLVD